MNQTLSLEEQRSCMDSLQLAGKLIMENGGEIYRVEETVTRMGQAFGLREVESFAVPSGLFISYRLSDGHEETMVKRIRPGGTNLIRVDQVNSISRQVENENLHPREAYLRLQEIRTAGLRQPLLLFGAGVCAAGFAWMFQGGWKEFLIAFVLSACVYELGCLFGKTRVSGVGTVLLESLVTVLIPRLLSQIIPDLQTEALIGGALMPLLPGLTMTNAVQDLMRGDMVSGISHATQALMTAALVAGGALVADAIIRFMMGGGI